METIKIEINFEQARALLGVALSGIKDIFNGVESAIDDVTYYDAQDGKFRDMLARFDAAIQLAHKSISQLDSLAKMVFPLFDESGEEGEDND